MKRQIILTDGEIPNFIGAWKVGEVLQMAQALAQWVEQLQVNQPEPEPIQNATKPIKV